MNVSTDDLCAGLDRLAVRARHKADLALAASQDATLPHKERVHALGMLSYHQGQVDVLDSIIEVFGKGESL